MNVVAALFVETNGCYFGLPHVDPWDEPRDARQYAGPYPVVAHPPCARWGSFWYGSPILHKLGRRKKLGDDDGCFAAALAAVRRWGGVIEHPRGSRAWAHFSIPKPHSDGAWAWTGDGWTCEVWQGSYGHLAYKPTWLYYVGPCPPTLKRGRPEGKYRPISGSSFHNAAERERALASGWKYQPRVSQKERFATPLAFRDMLIMLAMRSALGAFA